MDALTAIMPYMIGTIIICQLVPTYFTWHRLINEGRIKPIKKKCVTAQSFIDWLCILASIIFVGVMLGSTFF